MSSVVKKWVFDFPVREDTTIVYMDAQGYDFTDLRDKHNTVVDHYNELKRHALNLKEASAVLMGNFETHHEEEFDDARQKYEEAVAYLKTLTPNTK